MSFPLLLESPWKFSPQLLFGKPTTAYNLHRDMTKSEMISFKLIDNLKIHLSTPASKYTITPLTTIDVFGNQTLI